MLGVFERKKNFQNFSTNTYKVLILLVHLLKKKEIQWRNHFMRLACEFYKVFKFVEI